MNCLPTARSLKRFGRILRKMLPSSSRLPVFRSIWEDTSLDNSYFPLSQSPSQSYISFDELASEISDIWMSPKHVDSNSSRSSLASPYSTTVSSPSSPALSPVSSPALSPVSSPSLSRVSSPASSLTSSPLSPASSCASSGPSIGYHSWWIKPASKLPSLAESFSANLFDPVWCGSFLPPRGDKWPSDSTYSSIDSLQSFSYSPLSTFKPNDSTPSASSLIRLNVNDLSLLSSSIPVPNIDAILEDFEQNGVTKEVDEEFSPPKSSTPVTDRRSFQGQAQTPFNHQPVFYPKAPLKPPNWQKRPKVKPNKKALLNHCAFCKNNQRSKAEYSSHVTKDVEGRVSCPKLYRYVCPICKETGDKAHTLKYCPKRKIITAEDVALMDQQDKFKV